MVKIAPLCNLNANCINIFCQNVLSAIFLLFSPFPPPLPIHIIYTIYSPPASISSPRRAVPNATRPK